MLSVTVLKPVGLRAGMSWAETELLVAPSKLTRVTYGSKPARSTTMVKVPAARPDSSSGVTPSHWPG